MERGTKLTAEQLEGLADTADYIFEGWYDGENKAEGGTYTVTKDVTLVAKWKPREQVQISFKVSGNTVELSSEPAGAVIHYTTDGTEPKESWDEYANPIKISSETTIKAYAQGTGMKPSDVVEKTYLVVTFNANGGSEVAPQVVERGRTATKPDDPTLEGSWFSGWYGDSGLTKEFDFTTPITADTTVYAKWSYKLHTEPSLLTTYTSPNHTDSSWKYVEFGDWPQTIKAADVTVDETKSKTMGMFTCYLGSDGNHYVKYSNEYSNEYYKVESIVWRVLTDSYNGKSLLLAEKILTGGIPYYDVYKVYRTVGDTTIYPNNYEHSAVRAWLNGLEYQYKKDDNTAQTTEKKYLDVGFLQTAFTQSAQKLIELTTVDNRAASTNPASNPKRWSSGTNLYASATPTTDKIFLLSEAEATTSEYGFDEYTVVNVNNRIRVTTDYAKATGANQSSTPGWGGWWWLRSPYCLYEDRAHGINLNGNADSRDYVDYSRGDVVPALSISLK